MTDQLQELVTLIERHARGPVSTCALPRVALVRVDDPGEIVHELLVPVICLVVQGAKNVQFAGRSETFEPGMAVVSALDFPITGRVLEVPYRAVAVQLSTEPLGELLATETGQAEPGPDAPGFGIGPASEELVGALVRLLRLLDDDRARAALARGAEVEVLYRALQTSNGPVIRRFAREGHLSSPIEPAIAWIRDHLSEPVSVGDLAGRVHTSTRTLHRHFVAATGLSPVQFQKQLRLQEARKLLLGGGTSAAAAAGLVGYASASHFTRDYSRMFGSTPGQDAARRSPRPVA